jgi:hypothetical protein
MKTVALITLFLLMPASSQVLAGTLESEITAVGISADSCGPSGNCIHYITFVNADGNGSYIGLEGVGVKGAVALKVPKSSYGSIVHQLQRINFFKLRDSYVSKEDGCVEMWTDQGFATFYAIRNGKVKKVDIYWGCRIPGATKNLMELADLLLEATGTNKLIENTKQ